LRRGKKYTEKAKSLDNSRLYGPKEAIEWIIANHYVKFEEAVDISINLGVDPRKADQIVRGALVLPHGRMLVLIMSAEKTWWKRSAADGLILKYVSPHLI